MVLVSAESGFSFWFQFLPKEGVGVFLPIAAKGEIREGALQLKLPCGGYHAMAGYCSHTIANRGLTGH